MSTDRPMIGATVHFVPNQGTCRAATIVEVAPDTGSVRLEVHHPAEVRDRLYVDQGDIDMSPGTWHWPCGV